MLYTISDSINSIEITIPEINSGIADSIQSFSFDLMEIIEKTKVEINNIELITHPMCKNNIDTIKNTNRKYVNIVNDGKESSLFVFLIGNPQLVQFFALSLTSFPHSGHLISAIYPPPVT